MDFAPKLTGLRPSGIWLAARISIIQKGRIVAQGTLDELRAQVGKTAGATTGDADTATLEDVFLNLTEVG